MLVEWAGPIMPYLPYHMGVGPPNICKTYFRTLKYVKIRGISIMPYLPYLPYGTPPASKLVNMYFARAMGNRVACKTLRQLFYPLYWR